MSETRDTDLKPRYDLTLQEIRYLEAELVRLGEEQYYEEGVFGVWSEHNSQFADISRTNEESLFPGANETDISIEENSLFYLVIDARAAARRAVHSTTVTRFSSERLKQNLPTWTTVIDELVDMGNFSVNEFYQYYSKRGVEVENCIAVETNLRIGKERIPRYNGQRIADLAYIAIFEKFTRDNPRVDKVGTFARINRDSIASFALFGFDYELLMGRHDLVTPEAATGKSFTPVFIPVNEHNLGLFNAMAPFVLPEIQI